MLQWAEKMPAWREVSRWPSQRLRSSLENWWGQPRAEGHKPEHEAKSPDVLCCALPLSRVRHFETAQTVAHQAPLSMGFSRQEYWSGLPCPPPGYLSNPGIENTDCGTSLTVQWSGIRLPIQGTWVRSLVRKRGSHMPQGNWACAPQLKTPSATTGEPAHALLRESREPQGKPSAAGKKIFFN